MLAKPLIKEIDRLLKKGDLSQRKIAAKLHVSRGTVSAIANGRRGLYGREVGDDELSSLRPSTPPERCPRCGYRIYVPCLICSSRDFQQRRAVLRRAASAERSSVPHAEPQRQGGGETRRQGDIELTHSPACLLASPSPCLLVLDPFSPGMPFLTLIPITVSTPA